MEDAVRCVPECAFINGFIYLSVMGLGRNGVKTNITYISINK